MFFNKPGKPNKIKKAVYLFGATILGVILSFIAHAFIEMGYLVWAESRGLIVSFYNGCAFLPALQISLLVFGIVSGFFLGRFWWRKLYIERVWEKNKYNKK